MLMKLNICFDADLVLSKKLVLYDLEKKTIGWTPYDCEYSILGFLCSNLFSF